MWTKRIVLVLLVMCLLPVILWACLVGAVGYGPCKLPSDLKEQDLYGEWYVKYPLDRYVSDPVEGSLVISGTTTYLVAPGATPMSLEQCEKYGRLWPEVAWERCSLLRGKGYPMEGEEILVLRSDGTYQQSFAASTYSYTGPINKWELITDTPDSPKLRMYGMKYFAEGVPQANSSATIILHPQLPDRLRIQEYESRVSPTADLEIGVIYPTDGFVFLYPRICRGKLSLVQMAFRLGEPDYITITNLAFKRK